MFTSLYRPLAKRSGEQLAIGGAQIGTGGRALTATATVSVCIPIPRRKCKLLSINLSVTTAAAGSAAITVQAFRRNNTGTPADVTMTATSDLTATQFTVLDKSYDVPLTSTDATRVFQLNDDLRLDIVAAGTVSTAPQVAVSVLWGILD